ncbi:hypothetical protein C0J52_10565 [Blattella germanica]|nr:hypothetical protein C0J52_10565 [Blattella germanica]
MDDCRWRLGSEQKPPLTRNLRLQIYPLKLAQFAVNLNLYYDYTSQRTPFSSLKAMPKNRYKMAAIMNRYCENDGIEEVWEAGTCYSVEDVLIWFKVKVRTFYLALARSGLLRHMDTYRYRKDNHATTVTSNVEVASEQATSSYQRIAVKNSLMCHFEGTFNDHAVPEFI